MRFCVALTADFYDENGKSCYKDLGLDVFDGHDHIAISRFPEHRAEITPDQLRGCHASIVLMPRVTAHSLSDSQDLLVISRFGVGYDSVDVSACTENDVLLTITVGTVDRPVAEATIGWMLALTHRIIQKDRLVRTGRWRDRDQYMGCELRDRTLGVVGLGGIGRELVQLLSGFGMKQAVAFDPFASRNAFEELGVESVSLDELLSRSDFVSLHCPLTEQTRGLIGKDQLAMMKSDAYLLNLARGGIVDEDALYETLADGRIAGAALDCFGTEPLTEPPRLAELDNVLLAPHCIAWTNELFRDNGRTACQSVLDLSQGRRPFGVVNPEVFDRPTFIAKWDRIIADCKSE